MLYGGVGWAESISVSIEDQAGMWKQSVLKGRSGLKFAIYWSCSFILSGKK